MCSARTSPMPEVPKPMAGISAPRAASFGANVIEGRRDARSSMLEQRFLKPLGGLNKEHQHGAAVRRLRGVAAAFGADDEIAGGAFAFVVDQRAFEHERLLQILVHVGGDARTRLEL